MTIFPDLLLCVFTSPQVMQVVREQITRALAMKPSSIDQLKNKLRGLSYSEILRLRQSERLSQDDFQSPPIMSVKLLDLNVYYFFYNCGVIFSEHFQTLAAVAEFHLFHTLSSYILHVM